ncbi:MAG: Ig-like domain-containing protein [Acidobacteria bacterium]|nr:Ig-like domain-containing protein [Acidobacteriota bacterium]
MPDRMLPPNGGRAPAWTRRYVPSLLLTCSLLAFSPIDVAAQGPDADGDGLPDAWETTYGLNPAVGTGADGAAGDPDRDGLTNAEEFARTSHPRGFATRYLAEGATSDFFTTVISIVNADDAATARVLLRFLKTDGSVITRTESIGPRTRRTVLPKDLAGLEVAEFSTVVESDLPVVVDRTLTWDATGYGSHAETSVASPATTWYLAEGATHSGLDLFYLLQNPGTTAASVQVTYLRPAPLAPVVKTYTVAPTSRFNIWVDLEDPGLAATDVSAVIQVTNGVPIIVERALYLSTGGRLFNAGHESAAVRSPALNWFLAEGATGSYFDLFVLVANPTTTAAQVEARYLLPSGQVITRQYTVAPQSRFNVWVDYEDPILADTAVSTTMTSLNGVPIIVERSLWWPGPTAQSWAEAHNAAGSTVTGPRWVLAEGSLGGATATETYILVANTSATPGPVRVRLFFEDGTTAERTFTVGATSRFNVAVGPEFPEAAGRRFGAVIESTGTPALALVVERAIYDSTAGESWAAGSDALATPVVSTTDTDGDGITDASEAAAGTSPQATDTDNDGVSDGEEIARGSDPIGIETATVTTSPVGGEVNVGVTRETIVHFSQPLAPATVVNSGVLFAQAAGATLAARIEVSSDRRKVTLFYQQPLPGATRVRVTLVGAALFAKSGQAIDVDGDNQPGGTLLLDFDTVGMTRIGGTDVWGYVYDAYNLLPNGGNRPVVGATIRVDGLPQANAVTDSTGYFILHDMPAPEFFVHIDGTTATNAPAGFMYPSVGKPFHSIAGQSTQLTMDGTPFHVYLPPMAMGDVTALSPSAPTMVGFGPAGIAQLRVMFPTVDASLWSLVGALVAPGSATDDAGNDATQAVIIPVPPQRLPAPLPPGARPGLVISVQAIGATNFDTPVPVCFPNLPDPVTGIIAAPGTLQELLSFNHDAGRWDPVGPMRVNAAGTLVCTLPGVGVLAPGWHFPSPPPAGPDPPGCGGGGGGGSLDACPKPPPNPNNWWDWLTNPLGTAQQAFQNWLNGAMAQYEQSLHQPGGGPLVELATTDTPVTGADVRVTMPLGTPLDSCVSLAAYEGRIYAANAARAALVAFEFTANPSAIADIVLASAYAEQAVGLLVETQNRQCRDGAATGGIVTGPPANATADSLIASGRELAQRLYPYAVARATAIPQVERNELNALAASADQAAGGDAVAWLKTYIQNLEVAIVELEAHVGRPPGFEPREPTPYAAQILTPTGFFTDRGVTRAQGEYHLFVPPDQTVIQATFYFAPKRLFAVAYPRLRAGERVRFPRYYLGSATASDQDLDTLPDVAEMVYGTSSIDRDSDDDGVDDGAEIALGLDPLDNRPARTGVIRSIDTPGTATDVCASDTIALVADGTSGLAILRLERGVPTLAGQVDTPGTALAVACTQARALVADGSSGLAIVDVTDPPAATIVHLVDVGGAARAVVEAAGIAYVGTTNGRVVSVDVASGSVLDSLAVAQSIQDLAIAGDVLYVMSDGAVHTFPLTPSLVLAQTVASPRPNPEAAVRPRLFASTDTLWAVHSKGFNVFSLANPFAPAIVTTNSAGSGINPEFGWRQIVPTGSGSGLAVVDGSAVLDGPQDVALYDLSVPTNTNTRIVTFPTPGQARAAAIANGMALVADGTSGVQVVNYLAADTGTTAPALSLVTNQPAGTAEEGQVFRVTALADDDVQVRAVEFYVDGVLERVDVGYPFELRRMTPLHTVQPSFTLRVRAIDTGGNVTETAVTTIQITTDTTAPTVLGRTPRDGTEVDLGIATISAAFSEPVLPASLSPSNFTLHAAGLDGIAGNGDDVAVPGASVAFALQNRTGLLTLGSPLAAGLYRAVVGAGVSDVAGNVSSVPTSWTFRVVLGNIAGGEHFTINGNIATPGAEQTWSFTATAGQRVFFDAQNACGGGFQDLRYDVTDPSGALLISNAGLSACVADQGTKTLPLSGVYKVRVFGVSGATSAYVLKIWHLPTPVPVPITLDQTISSGVPAAGAGNIEWPGMTDVYVFTATAGQRVYFDGDNPCGGGFQDIRWSVKNPDGSDLFVSSGINGCVADTGERVLAQTGTYTVTVFGFNDAYTPGNANYTGYRATVWNANHPAPIAVSLNQTISSGVPAAGAGNLEHPGLVDIYTFTATAGQKVYFDSDNPCGAGFQDLRWGVKNPDGSDLFANAQISGCVLDAGERTLTQTGTYTVTVSGFNGAYTPVNPNYTGYRVTMWNANPPAPIAITLNQTISSGVPAAGAGNLEQPGTTDVYTFTATAGQKVYFDSDNPCGSGFQDLRWTARNPDGSDLFANAQISGCVLDVGERTLAQTGTYTVIVSGFNGAYTPVNPNYTGYKVTLWNANPPAPIAIALNQTISSGVPAAGAGNLEQPGATDIYTFSGTAGQKVYFDSDNPCGSGFQDLRWSVKNPDGSDLFVSAQISGCVVDAGERTLPQTGTYTITVFGFNGAYTPVNPNYTGYTVTAWNVPTPTPIAIAVGDTVSDNVPVDDAGRLETPGASDVYTFSGTASQVVNFDSLNPCGGFPDLRWSVTGPSGEVVFSNLQMSGCVADPGNRTLPATGTYTIRVTGANGAFAAYSFRIQ